MYPLRKEEIQLKARFKRYTYRFRNDSMRDREGKKNRSPSLLS
jgi:hypothetical protein